MAFIERTLFNSKNMHSDYEAKKLEARNAMQRLSYRIIADNKDRVDEFVDDFIAPYRFQPTTVSGDWELSDNDVWNGKSRVVLRIAYHGSKETFSYLPPTMEDRVLRNLDPAGVPGVVEGAYVVLRIEAESSSEIQSNAATIKELILDFLREFTEQGTKYNLEIAKLVKQIAIQRMDENEKHELRMKALPFQLAIRDDAPPRVAVPMHRKEIRVASSQVARSNQKVHYVLEQKEYDNILEILFDMARVLECNPGVFHRLDEETLRWLLLVPLNGHYKGQATGETFNGEGKTDIIIKHDSVNLFLAECKIWDGKSEFKAAIDQLLKYATARDTKLALILFIKAKDLSRVLKQIVPAITEHESFHEHDESFNRDMAYRFKLKVPNDSELLMQLTVMAFHVPERSQIHAN